MEPTKFKIYSLLLVKNEADIITTSLKSALKWSDKIIVIDNGSTDGTWELVRQMAATHPQIVAWLQYTGPFHIGIRAKAFRAFRHELKLGDWWCVRLDADELFETDVKQCLSQVPWYVQTVKKLSTDYVITKEDLEEYTFGNCFESERHNIKYCLKQKRAERRFMRHLPWLVWLEKWRYPHPWGKVWKQTIECKHYQYRSTQQMQKRYDTRQQAKTDGCGSFKHENGTNWQQYVLSKNDERVMLAAKQ